MSLLHVHMWRSRPHRGPRYERSLIQRCRCGLNRLGTLQWRPMTGTEFREMRRRASVDRGYPR